MNDPSNPIQFASRGKLMFSGEYLVLHGALSLAVPVKFQQRLKVVQTEGKPIINWKSTIKGKNWIDQNILISDIQYNNSHEESELDTLTKVLRVAKELNPRFLAPDRTYDVLSEMDFYPQWGIGSSSTFISNIAYWAQCDPFELNQRVFNGSGYDIACARSNGPILYRLIGKVRDITPVQFHPPFYKQLYFVYLNKKQNTRTSLIKHKITRIARSTTAKITKLTAAMLGCQELGHFQELLAEHEQIIGRLLDVSTIKETHFHDFYGSIKSLGAWGGDFILVASSLPEEKLKNYFKEKKLETIFRFDEIVYQGELN